MLEVVSEKTGYPVDSLELDMDIEADLGIDSIKRVEILGAMQSRFAELHRCVPRSSPPLRTLPGGRLRRTAESLTAGGRTRAPTHRTAGSSSAPAPAVVAGAGRPRGRAAGRLLRRRHGRRHRPDGQCRCRPARAWLADGRAPVPVIRLAGAVASCLRACTRSRWAPSTRSRSERSWSSRGGSRPDRHVRPPPPARGNRRRPRAGAAPARRLPRLNPAADVVGGVRSRRSRELRRRDASRRACSGPETETSTPQAEGSTGSSRRSVRNGRAVFSRAVDLAPTYAAERAARAVLDELADPDERLVEVGYGAHGRVTLAVEDAGRNARPDDPVGGEPVELVVVSGGARGITARCVIALARRYGWQFVLLGRTSTADPLPAWADDSHRRGRAEALARRRACRSRA